MKHRLALVVPFVVSLLPAQATLEWPGFRGPGRDGVAAAARPPVEWSATDNLVWKTELPGRGASSPIVVGDRVYVTCYSGYGLAAEDLGDREQLTHHLVCVNRASGEIEWQTRVPGPLASKARMVQIQEHGFATPTPVTDGERIYTYFGFAGVVAFDFAGEILWQADVGSPTPDAPGPTNTVVRDGQTLSLRWGAAASPLLHEGMVIVNAGEESNAIQAFDAATGERLWKHESANLEGTSTSPAVFAAGDGHVLVMVLAGEIWGMDPRSGEMLWTVQTEARGGMSPTPVAANGIAYCFGGGSGGRAIKLQLDEDEGEADRVLWVSSDIDLPSPVLYGDKLFLVDQEGRASCLRVSDGEVTFEERLKGRTGKIYASPVLADGRLYVTSQERGTFVYSADGNFDLLARNEIEGDEGPFNASPAIVGSQVLLRSDTRLYCFARSE